MNPVLKGTGPHYYQRTDPHYRGTDPQQIRVFVKGCRNQHKMFTLPLNSLGRDLKRMVKQSFGVPIYEQNLRLHGKFVGDSDYLLPENNLHTMDLTIPLLGGPVQFNEDIWDTVTVSVVLPRIVAKIKLDVKPYWQIGGRRGVIARALEDLDDITPHNLSPIDVRLVYCGKPMDPSQRIADYPGLTRKFQSGTFDDEHCGYSGYDDDPNPYGFVKPIVGTTPKRRKILVLELQSPQPSQVI